MKQRYLATVAYDGKDFWGWQSQHHHRNVQDCIEEALAKFHPVYVEIVGSGRTDRGVHAKGQRFHFDSDLNMTCHQMMAAINCNLPEDVKVTAMEVVPSSFHCRFHATRKRYDYLINNGPYDLFLRNSHLFVKDILDIQQMRQASLLLIGEHDFSTFCANRTSEKENQVRTITRLEIIKTDHTIQMIFEGKGFLRYMVRMLAQTLIEVGRGRITIDQVQEMLEAKDKDACRFNAKPYGLYLMEVHYEN
jgi:tRNA pseudouridine38-40 synthase